MVLCQQGLQFFPDKLTALREMHRVLIPGGRLVLSVWTGIGPYHKAVGEALAGFVGNTAATKFCASRQVPTKDELQRLATQAGFADVEVCVNQLDIHLPSLESFVLDHLAGTPAAPMIAATNPGDSEEDRRSCHGATAPLWPGRWNYLSGRNPSGNRSGLVTTGRHRANRRQAQFTSAYQRTRLRSASPQSPEFARARRHFGFVP